MLLYILISVLILAAGIKIAWPDRYDLKKLSAVMTLTISLAVTAMTWPFFLKTRGNILFAIFSAIKYGAGTVAMSGQEGIIDTLGLTGPMRYISAVLLYMYYIAGPIFASVFVISFSHSAMEWFRTRRKHTVHIFSQLNSDSLITALSIPKDDSMIIFTDTKDADEELKVKARAGHALLLEKEELDIPLLKGKEYNFYEINDSHDEALQRTVTLIERLKSAKQEIRKNTTIRCFVSYKELELIREIDRNKPKDINLRFIDIYRQESVRLMADLKDDLIVRGRKEIRFAVVGAGMAGTSLLKNAASLMILPETEYVIDVFDHKARDIAARLKAECPEILNLPLDCYFEDCKEEKKNLNIRFHQVNAERCELDEELMKYCPDVHAIVFTAGNDQLNFRTAKRISRLYASKSDTLSIPRLAIRIKDSDLRSMIRDTHAGMIVYGCSDENYRYENIVAPQLEETAARVHLSYLNSWYPGILDADAGRQSEVLWETGFYSYVNQDSSYAQALASLYRCAYIRANSDLSVHDYLKDEKNQKLLAEAEHCRWNMYQRFQGWRYLNHAQEMEVSRMLKGKKVKDDRYLLHPALVDTADLAEAESYADECLKAFNPESEGSKYILSDYQIIWMMPVILKVD